MAIESHLVELERKHQDNLYIPFIECFPYLLNWLYGD